MLKKLNDFKKIIVVAGLFSLFLHFSAILIYLTDGKYSPLIVNRAVSWYIIPVFHQQWDIFAPEPPMWNVRLYYRCKFSSREWSRWKEPGEHWLLKHYYNRFSYYGKMYAIHTRIARELYEARSNIFKNNSLNKNDFNLKMLQTPQYKLAAKYFENTAKKEYQGKNIKNIEFIYVAQYPAKFEDRHKSNQKEKMEVIRFPEIKFSE